MCTRLSMETVTLITLHTSPQCLLRHVSSRKIDKSYPFFFFRKENEVRPISLGLSLLWKRKPDFPLPWMCTQTSTYNKEECLYAEDFCMKDDWLPRWVIRFLRTGRILRKVWGETCRCSLVLWVWYMSSAVKCSCHLRWSNASYGFSIWILEATAGKLYILRHKC